jgi:hypothetical protein
LVCASSADNTRSLYIREDYVDIEGLQISMTPGHNYNCGIEVEDQAVANSVNIKKCIIKIIGTGGNNPFGVANSYNNAIVTVDDCVIIGGGGGEGSGIYSYAGTSLTSRACFVYGFATGIERYAGTISVINGSVFNNTNDFTGTMTVTYTGSDDNDVAGTGNYQITQTASNYAAYVIDAPNGNFTPTNSSSQLVGTGSNLYAYFTDDIKYSPRPSVGVWDGGAFQITAGSTVFVTTEPTGGAAGDGKILFDSTNNRFLFQTDVGAGYVTRGYIDASGTHDGAP